MLFKRDGDVERGVGNVRDRDMETKTKTETQQQRETGRVTQRESERVRRTD